jgi:hypothetical protein
LHPEGSGQASLASGRFPPPSYSPECVEGKFSEVELPLYGVLRSCNGGRFGSKIGAPSSTSRRAGCMPKKGRETLRVLGRFSRHFPPFDKSLPNNS